MSFILRNPVLAFIAILTTLGVGLSLVSTGPGGGGAPTPTANATAKPGDVVDGRKVTGSITVRKDGTVIENVYVKGRIEVRASNVTIRNAVVDYDGYHSIRIYSGAEGTKILDSTVVCRTSRTNGIVFGNYVANRVSLNGCRNGFMSSASAPATVTDSWVDGVPFELSDGKATSQPTTSSAPTEPSRPTSSPSSGPTTSTPSIPSAPTSAPPSSSEAASSSDSTFPTPSTTGPRQSSSRTTGNLASSRDDEAISRVTVNGRLTIRHDNVTVRDVVVNGTGTYMIQVVRKANGACPTNVRIEYTEINGAGAAENDVPLYSPNCGYTFDHGYIHNVGRASRLVHDTTISNSYIFSNRTGSSGAHRGAVGINGGTNNQIINNVLLCEGVGCSAAIPMYGDFSAVNGLLVQHNLLATTGSYCAYGGSVGSKPYPNGSNIRFIDNHFSTRYFPTCGRYGTVSGFDNAVRGNVWSGNVWHETGRTISAPR